MISLLSIINLFTSAFSFLLENKFILYIIIAIIIILSTYGYIQYNTSQRTRLKKENKKLEKIIEEQALCISKIQKVFQHSSPLMTKPGLYAMI